MSEPTVGLSLNIKGANEVGVVPVPFGTGGFTLIVEVTGSADDLDVQVTAAGGPIPSEAPAQLARFMRDLAEYLEDPEFTASWDGAVEEAFGDDS